MDNTQKDFFISYNSADRFWGEWIAWQLEQAGYSVIIQAWDFLAGQDFVIGMQEAVKAKHTIAVLSEDYFKADFTQPEWAVAFGRDPRGIQRTLIPVLVHPCKLEGFFATRIHIDITKDNEQGALKKLLAGVAPGNRHKPTTAPAFPGQRSAGTTVTGDASSAAKPAFPNHIPPVRTTIEIFTVAAPEDEDHLKRLDRQLISLKRQGWINNWNSGLILPGREIEAEIEAHWNISQVILLLISSDSLNGSYKMIDRALARAKAGTAHVIPILLRPCMHDFDTRQILPKNNRPISSWSDREEAYLEVAQGIRDVVKELLLKN